MTATTAHKTDSLVIDAPLLGSALALLALGLVMVGSASVDIGQDRTGQAFYFLLRQGIYVSVGAALAWGVLWLPLRFWERAGPLLFVAGLGMLVVVLVPGVGREVNGSVRWLGVGPFSLQASELVKLFVIVYLAGYLVRHEASVRASLWGFGKPLLALGAVTALLLLEPDYGTAVVIVVTGLGLLFLGGVRFWQFVLLIVPALGALGWLAWYAPYRLARLTTFLDPWADPYDRGFQLTQALIAFGRGQWLGVGLGASVQKLHYLPEAHTDFLFAVLAEELGLAGSLVVIGLFSFLVWRAFVIGRWAQQAGRLFAAYLAYGLGLWIALQVFVNLGVNMGMLPTKGLTLPLMSYGGSSIMVTCMAVALLLRIASELRLVGFGARGAQRGKE